MNTLRLSTLTLFLCCPFLSAVQAKESVRIAYSESLQSVSMQSSKQSTTSSHNNKPGDSPLNAMQFDAFGKRFDFKLEPNHTLLAAAKRQALAHQAAIYRGKIAGLEDSWVRLVVADGIPRGMFWDGKEMYAIDAIGGTTPGSDHAIVYRLEDLLIEPGALTCSAVGSSKNGANLFQAIAAELSTAVASGPGATSQIDMAVLGDFEFTSAKGANAELDLIARMNNVDGIFSAQVGVQLNVNQLDTFPSANDPFTDESDASVLIDELADFRNATPAQNSNGLTHLFTGRDLDGTTVGIAFGEALCSRRFGAGLTQGDNSPTFDSLIAAHEIGHNFGAPHDGTSGSACEAEPQDFLMAPRLNGSDTFSACSITEMRDDIARASCISPLAATDVALIASGQPATTLLGNTATVVYTVSSIGTGAAANVSFDVTIPATVSLSSISASAGSCTTGAGSANCSLGSIAAGSGVDVTINVATAGVGNADFVANITATVDENSNNNQATIQLVVDPAVDLVSTAAAAAQVNLNQSLTVQPVVENRSSLAATDVVVTISPNPGIRIDSASWASGSCSTAAGVATCQATTFGAQSNNTLNVQITGINAGSQSYTVSVTATELDRNPTNNNASGQVNVSGGSTTPGGGGGGGGGSLNLMALLLLLSVVLAELARRARPAIARSLAAAPGSGRSIENRARG